MIIESGWILILKEVGQNETVMERNTTLKILASIDLRPLISASYQNRQIY